jgi:hypothetical protein
MIFKVSLTVPTWDWGAATRLPRHLSTRGKLRWRSALVSACVGGAATIDDTTGMLLEAGFAEFRIKAKEDSRELISQWAPGYN